MSAHTSRRARLDTWALVVSAAMLRAIMLSRAVRPRSIAVQGGPSLAAVALLAARLRIAPALGSAAVGLAALAALPAWAAPADGVAVLASVKGGVSVRAPGAASYAPARGGAQLASGARVKTEAGGEARLEYPGGIVVEVKPGSELIVRVGAPGKSSGATLFLGRVWSKVAKSAGGDTKFEVESANAVAGVRGTEFEVGVGLDGTTRVRVSEGEVGVASEDERTVGVKSGKEIESEDGKLGKLRPAEGDPDWDGWFGKSAARMEKAGLKVAQSLDGRLGRRKAQVEKLIAEQKKLRQQIVRLEKAGEGSAAELARAHAQLEKVTARLESMASRLQGAFGLFATWSNRAKGLPDGEQIGAMARDVAKVAADFADMIEEGTDQSQEGMDELMDDMRKGKSDKPKDTAGDELFR